jgi:DNA-binding MarR family transcriptional regulator
MSPSPDPRLLVLAGMRLKGATDGPTLAEHTGLTRAAVDEQLQALADEGLVVEHTGQLTGWGLTPAGREAAAALMSAEVDAAGTRPAVARAYERFRPLNAVALDTCSRWQVRDIAGRPVVNDHTDHTYDAAVIGDLARLQREADPVLDDLADALDRYRAYKPRLRRAVRHVEAGDGDWFTKPSLPSYHTVWFELHEDLLTTLGLDRSAEVA